MDIEANYGKCIATYKGTGNLIFTDGRIIKCEFEAGQLLTGEIILLCESDLSSFDDPSSFDDITDPSISNFEGETTDGFSIVIKKRVSETNYLPTIASGKSGVWYAFRAAEMLVTMSAAKPINVRYGLTNFRFLGTTPFNVGSSYFNILPLSLIDSRGTVNLNIFPMKNYRKIIQRLQTVKGIEVTCEAVANIKMNGGIKRLNATIDSLCRVMSVARGTRIQGTYCDFYDNSNILIRRFHQSPITNPFCAWSPIDPTINGRTETKKFLEDGFQKYCERRNLYKLDETIDSYLDAKSEEDFSQSRGAKLAICLEKMKAVFLSLPGISVTALILDEPDFAKIQSKLKDGIGKILKAEGISSSNRAKIYGKIQELNRESFKPILKEFLMHIGLNVKSYEIDLFINCRNKLVHEGEFYCLTATPDERLKCKPLKSPQREFYFMVNFLDRIFLKLFGYRSLYVNYRSLASNQLKKEKLT